jgi:AraC-like DNA-binding protein
MLAVSSAALLEACASRGVEPAPLLAAVGVAGGAIHGPAARITTAIAVAPRARALRGPARALHAAEGVRFGAYRVLDYLVATAHTIGGAIEQLGFTQPSSFTRAFLRWTGKTPQAFRRAIAAGAAHPRPRHRG